MEFLRQYVEYLPHVASVLAFLDVVIIVITIPWVLAIKRESNAAVAWRLVVLLVPIFGFILFVIFGYSQVHRPVKRKRKHRIRRLMMIVLIGGGLTLAFSEGARKAVLDKLFGAEEEFEYSSTTTPA